MIHIKRKRKQKDDESENEAEKYKQFVHGNINILYDNILEIKNNNPNIGQDFNKILDIINLIAGRRTTATLCEEPNVRRDYILDRSSICSI